MNELEYVALRRKKKFKLQVEVDKSKNKSFGSFHDRDSVTEFQSYI